MDNWSIIASETLFRKQLPKSSFTTVPPSLTLFPDLVLPQPLEVSKQCCNFKPPCWMKCTVRNIMIITVLTCYVTVGVHPSTSTLFVITYLSLGGIFYHIPEKGLQGQLKIFVEFSDVVMNLQITFYGAAVPQPNLRVARCSASTTLKSLRLPAVRSSFSLKAPDSPHLINEVPGDHFSIVYGVIIHLLNNSPF